MVPLAGLNYEHTNSANFPSLQSPDSMVFHEAVKELQVLEEKMKNADNDAIGTEKFDVIISDLTAQIGPSINAYKAILSNIINSMNDKCFVSMHSGWWSNSNLVDYPSMIINNFSHIQIYNQWIDSFACFWSFMLGWKHEEDLNSLYNTMSNKITKIKEIRYFSAQNYFDQIFIRPGKINF